MTPGMGSGWCLSAGDLGLTGLWLQPWELRSSIFSREVHRVWSFLKWPLARLSSYSHGECGLPLVVFSPTFFKV